MSWRWASTSIRTSDRTRTRISSSSSSGSLIFQNKEHENKNSSDPIQHENQKGIGWFYSRGNPRGYHGCCHYVVGALPGLCVRIRAHDGDSRRPPRVPDHDQADGVYTTVRLYSAYRSHQISGDRHRVL